MSSRSKRQRRQAAPPPGPRSPSRRSFIRLRFVLFGLLALGLLVRFAVVRVGADERAFRLPAGGGAATRLGPGWHVIVPFAQTVRRLRPGPIRVEGEEPVQSREGVAFTVAYEAAAEIDDAALGAALGTSGGRAGPEAMMRPLIAEAVRSWGAASSGEALVLHQGARDLEAALRERLLARGFQSPVVRVGKAAGPAAAVASIETAALKERVVETGAKIAILGLDGADWEIIQPLLDRGELPNLARLKARSAWGNMKSMFPMLSPLLWTSVATGQPPEKHGIIDFLVKDVRTGNQVPVSSRWRKVKALWNIFTDAGRSSAFIAWWATWPSEPVTGYMVSDRVAYSLFGYEAAAGDRAGATFPPGYFQQIRPKIVDDASIRFPEVRPFFAIGAAEFAELRSRIGEDPKTAYRIPVNHLTKILASARSYQAIGLDILERGQPNLFSVYYEGIDEVCHRFAHYMPPKMAMVTQEDYDKYHDTVFAYYRYQDRLLGEMIAKLAPDTTIIVLSDHGFRNGSDRPQNDPPYIEGKPGLWHRRYGIVLFAGPTIKPGHLDTTNLLDIAPTVLYLAGLPVPEDMSGRVVVEAIDLRFKSRVPLHTIPSYEGLGKPLQPGREIVADSELDAELLEKLRSLGYTAGGDGAGSRGEAEPGGTAAGRDAPAVSPEKEDEKLVTGHLNEAGLALRAKDYAKAAAAVAAALQVAPGYAPALLLRVEVAAQQKQHAVVIDTARALLDRDPKVEPGLYLKLGKAYADGGRVDEGLAEMSRRLVGKPGIAELHSAFGSLLLRQKKTEAAEREFLEALRLDPSLGDPLTELHTMYEGTDRVLNLEPLVRRGLEINEKSIVHHNWMGMIYEWKKDLIHAEAEFHRAMELDPDGPGTLANLGALYGRSGRLDEAVAVLTRAVAKEPDNLEAWVNLGAAQGRLRHPREAIEALETARSKGVRTTTLYNALALAYLQNRQKDKALGYLRESLLIDPNQTDAQELLKAMSQSS